MVNHRQKYGLYLLLFVFCLISCVYFANTEGVPTKAELETLVENLSSALIGRFDKATVYETVTAAYNNPASKSTPSHKFGLKFEKVKPDVLVKDFAKKLSDMFLLKTEALHKSVQEAEQAALNHVWNGHIKKTDMKGSEAIEVTYNDSGLVYSERFKQKISLNTSSVQTPVDINDGDVEILNGLQWSAALDKVFIENYKKDPEILWQYFGSQSGFMRTLPASRWDTDEVDLYDVRRRPWYIQCVSSPKDMLILLDTSGSELIKATVKSLLDTLGENDFVYIAHFSKEAHSVSSCFNGSFVQANYRNKKKLIEEVDKIQAEGMANYKAGLTFAFEQFIKLKNETNGRRGADCNKLIMVLTDGGTDLNAEDVFRKYNPFNNQTYRVFTYAVGPTAKEISALRWMACANRGSFSRIPAMSAVRNKVQEYLTVIGRPPVLHNAKQLQWSTVYPDTLGLGMVTTVALPVYNRTSPYDGVPDQTILGVMGIDVTTEAMLKYAPLQKFGPNGFPFAINANGYIVFHPNLKAQKDLKDPPNVDFLEVEADSPGKVELRNRMIDQEEDTLTMETFTVSQDQRHVDIENGDRQRMYSFRGIDHTPFSLGVSIPLYHEHHLIVETEIQTPVNDQRESLLKNPKTAMLIPDWEFYKDFLASKTTGSVLDLQEALENPSRYKWDNELINHLLFDISVTSKIDGFWPLLQSDGLLGVFIATMGGLTKIYPNREDLVKQFLDQRDPWKANYFKRAIDAPHLIFSAPYVLDPESTRLSVNESPGEVMVVRSVSIYNSQMDLNLGQGPNYKAAVVGAVFTHEHVRDTMVRTSNQTNIGNCGDPSTTACYLLDNGAFVIATNQEQYYINVGSFFGKVDPEVMFQLYNSSFFHRLEQYNYTARCLDVNDKSSAAGFNIPFIAMFYEFLTFNWWSSVMTWTITNFNMYNILYTATTHGIEDELFNMDKTRECVKKQAQYYYSDLKYLEGQTDCTVKNINCSRDFVVHRVDETNLVLVISEAEKDGCDKCRANINPKDLIQEPVELSEEEVDAHLCHMKTRYRRTTSQCYDSHPMEDNSKCAASLTHPVSMVIVVLVSIATTLFSNW